MNLELSLPVCIVCVVVASYLLGSFPTGVIVARVGYGGDPRDGGSGSIGMTNMNRLFGFKAAVITFIGDAVKGMLASGLARLLLGMTAGGADLALWVSDAVLVCAVLASMIGHMASPWLGFAGGKGISTGFGSILVAFPLVCLVITICFAVLAGATKTVSAGSMAAAVAFPVACCALHWGSWVLIGMAVVVAVAVVWAHRGNIRRLAAGEEPKFSIHRDL